MMNTPFSVKCSVECVINEGDSFNDFRCQSRGMLSDILALTSRYVVAPHQEVRHLSIIISQASEKTTNKGLPFESLRFDKKYF